MCPPDRPVPAWRPRRLGRPRNQDEAVRRSQPAAWHPQSRRWRREDLWEARQDEPLRRQAPGRKPPARAGPAMRPAVPGERPGVAGQSGLPPEKEALGERPKRRPHPAGQAPERSSGPVQGLLPVERAAARPDPVRLGSAGQQSAAPLQRLSTTQACQTPEAPPLRDAAPSHLPSTVCWGSDSPGEGTTRPGGRQVVPGPLQYHSRSAPGWAAEFQFGQPTRARSRWPRAAPAKCPRTRTLGGARRGGKRDVPARRLVFGFRCRSGARPSRANATNPGLGPEPAGSAADRPSAQRTGSPGAPATRPAEPGRTSGDCRQARERSSRSSRQVAVPAMGRDRHLQRRDFVRQKERARPDCPAPASAMETRPSRKNRHPRADSQSAGVPC